MENTVITIISGTAPIINRPISDSTEYDLPPLIDNLSWFHKKVKVVKKPKRLKRNCIKEI
jgi:hypothetical protein